MTYERAMVSVGGKEDEFQWGGDRPNTDSWDRDVRRAQSIES